MDLRLNGSLPGCEDDLGFLRGSISSKRRTKTNVQCAIIHRWMDLCQESSDDFSLDDVILMSQIRPRWSQSPEQSINCVKTSANSRTMHILLLLPPIDMEMSTWLHRPRTGSIFAIKEHFSQLAFHKLAFYWKPSARCIWVLTLEREPASEMPIKIKCEFSISIQMNFSFRIHFVDFQLRFDWWTQATPNFKLPTYCCRSLLMIIAVHLLKRWIID